MGTFTVCTECFTRSTMLLVYLAVVCLAFEQQLIGGIDLPRPPSGPIPSLPPADIQPPPPGPMPPMPPFPPGKPVISPSRDNPKSGGSYFITFARDVHRGMPFNVSVDILNTSVPVNVQVELQRTWYNLTNLIRQTVAGAQGIFVQGQTGTLQINTPNQLESGRYVVHVRGSNGLNFEREKDVTFTYKTISIMVQTDKAMYKPGQKVRFRILGIYPNLQTYGGSFVVSITDPNWNKIKHWSSIRTSAGVVTGEFQLADQTVFGEWRISVQAEDQLETVTKTFTVAEYKLPRFEVTVELPPFAVSSDAALSGTVKATYTFGKPVKGMVELQAKVDIPDNVCGPPSKHVQLAFPIDGSAVFSIPLGDLKRLSFNLENQPFRVTAFVKEELTGVRLNGSSTVEFHKYPYKIEILSSSPSTFSPKLPYSAILKVSQPDGRPLTGVTSPVSVYTCVNYHEVRDDQSLYGCREFTGSYGLPGQNHSLPASGILPVHFKIPDNVIKLEVKAHYREVSDTYMVTKKDSLSNNFLQIRLASQGVQANQFASFSVEYTENITSFTYQVSARGSLLLIDDVTVAGQNPITFQVPISHVMAPVAYIVVYYVRTTGEVVADSISFTVDEVFDNEVSISFNRNESKPNENINLQLSADPLSTINVLAVDQSVLLLKSGNDITPESVVEELKTYGSARTSGEFSPEVYAIATGAKRAPDVFSNAGLNVITDATKYNHYYPDRTRRVHGFGGAGHFGGFASNQMMARASPAMEMAMDSEGSGAMAFGKASGPPGSLKKPDRVRNVFPESWLWISQTVGPTGQASVTTTVPDTITSWIASAFAVSPTSGLGVAPTTAKLRVFQSFFVSLNMPSSVLRGEFVVIQASVFNYLSTDLQVTVSMPMSSNYSNVVVDSTGKMREESKSQKIVVTIAANKPQTVYFPIKPLEIGTIFIEVTASSSIAADAVRRPLTVYSEGIKKELIAPLFVGLAPGAPSFRQVVPLTLPPELVRGSEEARLKVTGNLVGSTLENLEKLLSLPTGCGEQNMMGFAPNVHLAKYLRRTNQMTPARWSRLINNMEMGFQRQLTYQRSDGSFSAFGNRDESGSMWLTAFVARVFHQARPFILVDNSTLSRAVTWMAGRQNKDGSFNEPGLVIDRKMQRSREALTGVVLLSLMENKDIMTDKSMTELSDMTIANAVKYLESVAPTVNDSFTQAVISFALQQAGSPIADVPFQKLEASAQFRGSLKFWTESGSSVPTSSYYTRWAPPTIPAQPMDIQITSYALMSYTARGDLRGGFPVIMWMSTQRNPNGGFTSTQDTMIAIEAMTSFNEKIHMSGLQVNLAVTGGNNNIAVNVNDQNALVLQIKEFSTFPNEVVVQGTGTGVAFVEIDAFYHVNAEIGNPAFDVNTVLLDDTLNNFRLMTCTKWLKEENSGMAAMEISIPSGFEPDMTSIGNVAGLKRVERRGRNVVVYFDQIGTTSICFDLLSTRNGMVTNNQQSYVTVYDYYQPENQASIFYQPKSLSTAGICDVCPGCCEQQKLPPFP